MLEMRKSFLIHCFTSIKPRYVLLYTTIFVIKCCKTVSQFYRHGKEDFVRFKETFENKIILSVSYF